MRKILAVGLSASLIFSIAVAQKALAESPAITLRVQTDQPAHAISPILNGIFFEDINFAADGGLYPERVKNRSFEFSDSLMGWRKQERGGAVGGLGVVNDGALNVNNPHFLRITVENPGEGFGLVNEGFRGIGVTQGAKFTFSAYARSKSSDPMTLSIDLVDARNKSIGHAELSGFTGEWKKLSCSIEAAITDPK